MNHFGRESELYIKTSLNSKGKTILADSFFTSPFKIMKPFEKDGGGLEIFIQSASAGIMEGDRQTQRFDIGEGSLVQIVSQSFEKIFKMDEGKSASRKIKAHVSKGSLFIFTPLPCVPFGGSDFSSHTEIHLEDETSRLIYQDIITCGRKTYGEMFAFRSYKNLVAITRGKENSLIYRDNAVYEGSDSGKFPANEEALKGDAMFSGFSHCGTMLFFGFDYSTADFFRTLNLDSKLLYTQDEGKKNSASLVSVTQTYGNGIAVKVLAKKAEDIQKVFLSLLG